MKKIISVLFAAFLLAIPVALSGCNFLNDNPAKPALTLSNEAISLTNALGGKTTAELTATLEGSESSLEWYSTNKEIVSVSASGTNALLTCEGTAGTAKVGVRTADGELEATCFVTVSLSKTPAGCVSDVAVTEGSETTNGFTLTWKDTSLASKVVIDVFESAEARTAANELAAAKSDEQPVVVKSYSVGMGKQTYTITDLLTDSDGKEYFVSVYGFLNGYRSTTFENVEATLLADTTAPGDVTGIELAQDAGDHSLVVSWTEPADDDYKNVTITISPTTGFAGTLDDAAVTQTIGSGTYKAAFANLKSETEYTFTFKTSDVNGNIQSDGCTAKFTTAKDETAPAAPSAVDGSAGRTSGTVTWTDPSTVDLKEFHIYEAESTSYDTVAKSTATGDDAGKNSWSVTGLSANTSYSYVVKAVDYDGNESEGVDVTITTHDPIATNVESLVTDVDMTTGELTAKVSWDAPSAIEYDALENVVTYTYKLVVKNGATTFKTVADIASTNTTVSGLEYGTDYTYEVTTIPSDTGEYIGADSKLTKKALGFVHVKNNWGGRVLLPFVSGTKTYVNCVIVQDDASKTYHPEVMKYPYLIVRPALDGTEGYFSLEAAEEDGTASGKYIYFSSTTPSGSTNYDVDSTGWGSGSSPHCFYGDATQIGTDIGNACFKFDVETGKEQTLTGCTPWQAVKTSSGKYFWSGNSNPGLKDSLDKSSGDYSWCYKVIGK